MQDLTLSLAAGDKTPSDRAPPITTVARSRQLKMHPNESQGNQES